MVTAYEEQAAALIEGGVDLLLIETAQDLLQAKIATIGVLEAMRKSGKRLPVQVQVTLQETGLMLLGTEIGAALTALEPFDVDAIGLNCATGPKEMNDSVRYLGLNSTKHISVLPNAGLPQNVGGHAVYNLSPQELADYHKHFVQDYGVRIVGGCCGTTPEHLKAVVDAVSGVEPAKREVERVGAASSAYTSVPLDLEPKPLIVAEEMNTTTRVDHFRKLVQVKKYDEILALAKKLANEGSHMTGIDWGFDVRSFEVSRTIPRKAPSAFEENTCWYVTTPIVSKLSPSWRCPAACCTCSFGIRNRDSACLTIRPSRSFDVRSRSKWTEKSPVVPVFVKFSGTTGFR